MSSHRKLVFLHFSSNSISQYLGEKKKKERKKKEKSLAHQRLLKKKTQILRGLLFEYLSHYLDLFLIWQPEHLVSAVDRQKSFIILFNLSVYLNERKVWGF